MPALDLQSQTVAQEAAQGENANTQSPLAGATRPQGSEELTEEERKEVEELKRRDREVRAHEQAHKSAGGSIAGSPSFETISGPDGRSYAVGGEVKIDTSPVPNNPDATIRKMEIVKRAALAPSQPSAQDRQVAAEAEQKIQQARLEKREQEAAERADNTGIGAPESAGAAGLTQSFADRANAAFGAQSIGSQFDPGSLLDLVA